MHLNLTSRISNGHFGLSILDGEDDTVVAGWGWDPVHLSAGSPIFDVRLPQLPLRPGMYRLSLALFDGGNNLTGGRLVEKWTAVQPLGLDVPPVAHPQTEWAGLLNVAARLDVIGDPHVERTWEAAGVGAPDFTLKA